MFRKFFLGCYVAQARLLASCLKTSQRLHTVYKAFRMPLHGAYFCVSAFELHSPLFIIPIGLLIMLVVGYFIEERL